MRLVILILGISQISFSMKATKISEIEHVLLPKQCGVLDGVNKGITEVWKGFQKKREVWSNMFLNSF